VSLLRFLARYLGPLKELPLLPQLADALLVLGHLLFAREVVGRIERVSARAAAWPGVSLSLHRYGGLQLNVGRREIGHIHGNGVVDIHFSLAMRDALVSAGRALPHHRFPDSGWISLPLRSEADACQAIRLLQLSFEQRREAIARSKAKQQPAPQ
jgi:hypothetical protein